MFTLSLVLRSAIRKENLFLLFVMGELKAVEIVRKAYFLL